MQVAGLPDHDHACFLGPRGPADDARIVAAVAESAERGLRPVLVVGTGHPAVRRAEGWHALLRTAHAEAAIEIVHADDGYGAGAPFDPATQVAAWGDRVDAARRVGYAGLFVIGDMEWAEREAVSADVLLEYEARVNDLHARVPITGICDYGFARRGTRLARQIAGIHPAVRGTSAPILRSRLFSVTRAGDRTLRIAGELDATVAGELGEALLPTVAWHRDVTLVVDELEFADVQALRVLARLGNELRGRGHRLLLHGLSPSLRQAIVTCRWNDVLLEGPA